MSATPRRLLTAVAAASATVALASACGGGSGAPGSDASSPATFTNSYLSFRYPTTWSTYPFKWSGELHFHPMLYVSTQPVRNPCRTQSQTVVCGWPVDELDPGGILITLENRGAPGWSLGDAAGKAFRVGGRPARRNVDRPGSCGAIGGEETVDVDVASPQPGNWTELLACLRGPRLGSNEHRVDALLRSVRFR